jgi:regulatory protein
MKVTGIKQQLRRKDRISVFIDGKYTLSLSEAALLESKLIVGQELSAAELKKIRELASEDGLYDQALRYAVMRLRTIGEMSSYLQRKGVSPALAETILNKLSKIGIVDDGKFASAYVADRQRLRPTSRRKIIYELRAKHVAEDVIQSALNEEQDEEQTTLRALIKRKRQISRYQDDVKLMQYLARQGFSYGDIKAALTAENES